ncbi:MAG: erythromycin esterase family protein [Clostridia bacterium]|nr:erythromycin esterase family protein [Lachnospiraceae bacterium]NCC00690.1 erythromycin esterase family protein [Clostridia bacterium]NCD02703.1 erythromycin esterase family protein [Clostridia bacterium]
MKFSKCYAVATAGLVLCASLFTGCGQRTPSQPVSSVAESIEDAPDLDISALVYDTAEITIPESARIVALGEASHGAYEMQLLKTEVFQALVTNNDCRVFAIEGDFGGCAKVEEYIHGGDGTAEEAASQIGFAIYKTEEMADLIQWMREYNETAGEGRDLHFLGFDMQRYDNSKAYLLSYLYENTPELAAEYEEKLALLTNENMWNLTSDELKSAEADLTSLIETMDGGSFDADFAKECAQSMLEFVQVRLNESQYNVYRDAAMKDKVDWICSHYDGLIFINGHNGHITKESSSGYECMGALLYNSYKDAYFPIGTDIANCTFNSQTDDGFEVCSVENANTLTAQLDTTKGNYYYLDFSRVAEDTSWQNVLNSKQRMMALNISLNQAMINFKPAYTLEIIPSESYDGLIVVNQTEPTHLLP